MRRRSCDLGLALVEPGARIGPGSDVGLRETGFGRAALDGVDIGDRAVRGDRRRHEPGDALARVARDGVGDEAADRIVGAAGAAGADAEEGRRLRERQGGAEGAGSDGERQATGSKGGHRCSSHGRMAANDTSIRGLVYGKLRLASGKRQARGYARMSSRVSAIASATRRTAALARNEASAASASTASAARSTSGAATKPSGSAKGAEGS